MRFSVGYLRQSIEWSMNVSSPVSSPVTSVKKSSLSQTSQLRITLGYVNFSQAIMEKGRATLSCPPFRFKEGPNTRPIAYVLRKSQRYYGHRP